MVQVIKDDLFNGFGRDYDVLIHGCNCFNIMGGGVAKQVAKRFPAAFEADARTMYYNDGTQLTTKELHEKLGQFSVAEVEDGRFVVNLYTQYGLSDGPDVFEYDAFERGLEAVFTFPRFADSKFGMPRIGEGLANGNMVIIRATLYAVASAHAPGRVFVYDLLR